MRGITPDKKTPRKISRRFCFCNKESARHQKESINDAGIAHIRVHPIKNFYAKNFAHVNRRPAIHAKLSRENIGLKTALLGTFVSFLKLSTHRACDSFCTPLRFAHFIICKNKPERPSAFLWRFISRLQKLLEEEERQNHLSAYLKVRVSLVDLLPPHQRGGKALRT